MLYAHSMPIVLRISTAITHILRWRYLFLGLLEAFGTPPSEEEPIKPLFRAAVTEMLKWLYIQPMAFMSLLLAFQWVNSDTVQYIDDTKGLLALFEKSSAALPNKEGGAMLNRFSGRFLRANGVRYEPMYVEFWKVLSSSFDLSPIWALWLAKIWLTSKT